MHIENAKEDYSKSDDTHLVIGESKIIGSNRTDRIVVPNYGSFFFDSLVVVDVKSNRELIIGRDIETTMIDELATLRSGRKVVLGFTVINQTIEEVKYNYHYVGGSHSNGKYLIAKLKEQYPDGMDTTYHWDNILGKPETFKSKPHTHDVRGTYGYDEVIHQLQRMAKGTAKDNPESLASILNAANELITQLEAKTDDDLNSIKDVLQEAFERLRVQEGEYIFTDTNENPAIKRGYGRWIQITNTFLQGAGSDLVIGDGTVLSLGTSIAVRNTYIWKNQASGFRPTYTLDTDALDKGGAIHKVNEGETITVTLNTTDVPSGYPVRWLITGINPLYVENPKNQVSGIVYLDDNSKFQLPLKFLNDPSTPGDRMVTFRLDEILASSALKILVKDTVKTKGVKIWFSHDRYGNDVAGTIGEGVPFYLQLELFNYEIGEDIFIDWSASSVAARDFEGFRPSILQATDVRMSVMLQLKANNVTDTTRSIVAYYIPELGAPITDTSPMARVNVRDTSPSDVVFITFTDLQGNRIISIPEGAEFNIVINTSLSLGSRVGLSYVSTKNLELFTGLRQEVTVDSAGRATFRARSILDHSTSSGAQYLMVTALLGFDDAAQAELLIRDTSVDPEYDIYYTKKGSLTPITEIGEGEDFTLHISARGHDFKGAPPRLLMSYGLNEHYSDRNGLTRRITGTFHSALIFSSASAVYGDVNFNAATNLLSIDFKTINDNMFSAAADFTVEFIQQHGETVFKAPRLKILDTSVLEISAGWSSSSVTFTPITSVSEMLENGGNRTAYLWITTEGDGSQFGDIELTASGTAGESDYLTVFPSTIRFDAGDGTYVFAVEMKADFIAEGSETLTVKGSHSLSGTLTPMFESSIQIVDNSVKNELNVRHSRYPASIAALAEYSEYQPIYIHIVHPRYIFASALEWSISWTGPQGQQFRQTSGRVIVPASSASSVITLEPIPDYINDGKIDVTVDVVQTTPSVDTPIASGSTTFVLGDDSLPMALDIALYSDSARTRRITDAVDEGVPIYGRITVANVPDNRYLVLNTTVVNDTVVGGVNKLGFNGQTVNNPNQGKVLSIHSRSTDTSSVNVDFELETLADRSTSLYPQVLEIGVMAFANDSVSPVNVGDSATTGWVESVPFTKTSVTVNDTSLSSGYTAAIVPGTSNTPITSGLEGTDFRVSLRVQDGSVNDVFVVTRTNGFDVSRFEVSELGVEKTLTTSLQTLYWNFRIRPEYVTTTGNEVTFTITNKTTGAIVATLNYTNIDKYKTPTLSIDARIRVPNGSGFTWNTFPNRVYETFAKDALHYIRIMGDENLTPEDTLTVTITGGRPLSMWDNGTNWNGAKTPINLSGGVDDDGSHSSARLGVLIMSNPTRDFTTNTAEHNFIEGYVTTSLSNVRLNFRFTIMDTSVNRQFTKLEWQSEAGAVITSTTEGSVVYAVAVMSGDSIPFDLRLTNQNGRATNMLVSHEYNVTKSRDSDNHLVRWRFAISEDRSNVDTEISQRLRVQIATTSGPSVSEIITLPIANTSKSMGGNIDVFNKGTTTPVGTLIEDINPVEVDVVVRVANMATNDSIRIVIDSQRTVVSGDTWKQNLTVARSSMTANGEFHEYRVPIKIMPNSATDFNKNLNVELHSVTTNALLAASTIVLVDMSREPLAKSYITIHSRTDASMAHLSTIDEGVTYGILFKKEWFEGTDWVTKSFKWRAVLEDGTVFNNSSGTISRANVSTGTGDSIVYKDYVTTIAIPANYATDPTRRIKIILEEVYTPTNLSKVRGESNLSTIRDTSPTPTIDAVFFTKSSAQTQPSAGLTSFNEGDTIYIHVMATGLSPQDGAVNVNMTYGGSANADDFNAARPTTISCALVDAANRKYYGVSSAIVIKEDKVEG